MGWETAAEAKKANLLDLIPGPWRLKPSEIPSVTDLRDVTNYICQFLDPRELEITNCSSVKVLENIRSLEWSAVDVTRAFSHRAAVAHQLVSNLSFLLRTVTKYLYRPTVYLRHASLLLSSVRNGLMSI
jgi:amidase